MVVLCLYVFARMLLGINSYAVSGGYLPFDGGLW